MTIKYELIQPTTILKKLEYEDEVFLSRYSLNPYLGCEHGCQYCYVQADRYLPFKKEKDFFRVVKVKTNAPYLLKETLSKFKGKEIICMGTFCDPYQPIEKKYNITRRLLEIFLDLEFPVHILTKSDLVLRDLDLLQEISKKTFCTVSFSLTTIDPKLAVMFEPHAPSFQKRLLAMKKITKKKVMTGIILMPIIPYLTDEEKSINLIQKAKEIGAKYVVPGEMILKDNQKMRFLSLIKRYYPHLVQRYQALYRKGLSPYPTYNWRISKQISAFCEKIKMPQKIPTEKINF
ncbi:radical SAM protein [bacterium]|nr:radical SAM protein [bacterium]